MKTSNHAFLQREINAAAATRMILGNSERSTKMEILGQGTTCDFSRPLAHKEKHLEREARSLKSYRGTETILLAEDDPAVRKMISLILRERGYAIIEAADGNEAVRQFADHKSAIDLAILDVIMPYKNGQEVYRDLTGISPGLKTLFMSGYTNDIVLEHRGTPDDRVGFIAKPMMLNELLQKVRQILDTPRSL